eukprot:1504584-Pyramimonas_sp.AAC.1
MADAAAATSDENELMPLIAQTAEDPAVDRKDGDRERLILEDCCGPHGKIGNPRNFVDNSCRVIRYTGSEDMRTEKGTNKAFTDIRELRGNIFRFGVRSRVLEVLLGSVLTKLTMSVKVSAGLFDGSEESEH